MPLIAVIHLVQAAGGPHLPARAPSGAEIPQTAGFFVVVYRTENQVAPLLLYSRAAGEHCNIFFVLEDTFSTTLEFL
jgi:hypothetical protein